MFMDWDGGAGGGLAGAGELGDTMNANSAVQPPSNHWAFYGFVVTAGGLMAWVPQGSRVGDVLVFFKGAADLPFLLRPVGLEDPDRFYLVGDAYFQGFMQGQSRELDLEEWFILV